MSEFNPLVQRVDALLRRHQQQAGQGTQAAVPAEPPAIDEPAPPHAPDADAATAVLPPTGGAIDAISHAVQPAGREDDFPVLTEIVDPDAAAGLSPPDRSRVDAIEVAVIGKVLAELDLSLDMRLNRTIGEVLEQAMDGLRADLADHVRRVVHEAVAAALTKSDTDDRNRS